MYSLFAMLVAYSTSLRSARAAFDENSKKDFASDYAAIGYDTGDGLASAEINAVAQTKDGYIWAGTYSGLYRYDGYKFEKMQLNEHINNVMQLFVDSLGKLWIGTNDSGIACYDPDTKETVFYTTLIEKIYSRFQTPDNKICCPEFF